MFIALIWVCLSAWFVYLGCFVVCLLLLTCFMVCFCLWVADVEFAVILFVLRNDGFVYCYWFNNMVSGRDV